MAVAHSTAQPGTADPAGRRTDFTAGVTSRPAGQVRSGKQDQHHNSIVSTLLALIDGVDELGQATLPARARPRAPPNAAAHACVLKAPVVNAHAPDLMLARRTQARTRACDTRDARARAREANTDTQKKRTHARTRTFTSVQVVVIGATNRPDAIDPALRRPGRFDREVCARARARVCVRARVCACVCVCFSA